MLSPAQFARLPCAQQLFPRRRRRRATSVTGRSPLQAGRCVPLWSSSPTCVLPTGGGMSLATAATLRGAVESARRPRAITAWASTRGVGSITKSTSSESLPPGRSTSATASTAARRARPGGARGFASPRLMTPLHCRAFVQNAFIVLTLTPGVITAPAIAGGGRNAGLPSSAVQVGSGMAALLPRRRSLPLPTRRTFVLCSPLTPVSARRARPTRRATQPPTYPGRRVRPAPGTPRSCRARG